MQTSRNQRVPMSEQIRLITECIRSGITDADWRRKHCFAPNTYYNSMRQLTKSPFLHMDIRILPDQNSL